MKRFLVTFSEREEEEEKDVGGGVRALIIYMGISLCDINMKHFSSDHIAIFVL